jgi:hypothetical protein
MDCYVWMCRLLFLAVGGVRQVIVRPSGDHDVLDGRIVACWGFSQTCWVDPVSPKVQHADQQKLFPRHSLKVWDW